MPTPPEPSAREQLLRLQRETFARLEEEIHSAQRRESRSLRAYRRRYDRQVRAYRRIVTKAQLLGQVTAADIVYCGDYHTLMQAQRTAVRLLSPVLAQGRKVTLALEMIPKNAEKIANDFLRGELPEEAFLEKMDYRNTWGFPWPHYRQLFELARKAGVDVVGLGSNLSDRLPLEARDDLAADFIVEAALSDPQKLLFCLYGDLHIAEPHIPHRVQMRLERYGLKRKTLLIYQNSEEIYWKLAEQGLETTADVVEIARNKYCILSAPPWIKWRSYKTWIEDNSDLLEDPGDHEGAGETRDFYHQVFDLAQRIASFLGLKPRELDRFNVLTATDLNVIEVLEKYTKSLERPNIPVRSLIRAEILENQSCLLPERSVLYLSDLSENRAAEKAAQLVAAKMDPDPSGWVYGDSKDPKEVFYRLTLWEAIGFFGSKVINPKRKCSQYRDFEVLIETTRRQRLKEGQRDHREVAIQLLAHRAYELRRIKSGRAGGAPRKLYRLPPRQYFLAACHLGQILAHRLYEGLASERVSMDTIRGLFSPLPKDANGAESRYWDSAKILRHELLGTESKEDRF
ncbi:MAG: ChaN family lipoprotein [Pseudomonadota bacterium]